MNNTRILESYKKSLKANMQLILDSVTKLPNEELEQHLFVINRIDDVIKDINKEIKRRKAYE